ncbi:MAG: polyprenyl synthetase family protein [Lentisphaeria bacterium]|nr:polyprenyl synthetase family protein [Lentisphaeria bacterium]
MADLDHTRPEPAATADRRVPRDRSRRDRLHAAVAEYLEARDLVPPLTLDEIRLHAEEVARAHGFTPYVDYLMALLGSALWRDTVAAVPYDRRILLLPQCLRSTAACRAQADAYGLLCAGCGTCPIAELTAEAEALGYVVLVAEGTTVVTQLLEQGQIDAVIGVSCLEALERSFPHLAAGAIPGMAVPLNRCGCVDTTVDVDRVRELLYLRADREEFRLDVEAIRREVDGWFQPAALEAVLGSDGGDPGRIALEWLGRSGKRWRPFLTAAAWRALAGTSAGSEGEAVRRLALAVECFHKASLIHDDIEDGDGTRYEQPALHVARGVPIALNVGDLLIGEGYRLVGCCGLPAERIAALLRVAADGHRLLAVGQGEELAWCRSPGPLHTDRLIDVYRMKTAPAFSVALRFGAICAGCDDTDEPLDRFSAALGTAYQIRDDLDDFRDNPPDNERLQRLQHPTIVAAVAFEFADEHSQMAIVEAWRQGNLHCAAGRRLAELSAHPAVLGKVDMLLEHYRNEAVRSLASLRSSQLKLLLRRLTGRILGTGVRA